MRQEFLPFSKPSIGKQEIAGAIDNFCSDWITTGPRMKRFEQEFAEAVDAPAALALGSRTARGIGAAARRAFDVICAAVGLVFLAPALAIIAAAIKWEDGGPVLYMQKRIGKGFRPFRLFKFRSMIPGTSGTLELTGPQDPRVTTVGRFLRRHKLDELLQLINVVKGDMQLVGVRPQTERFVHFFPVEYSILLQEPPGITDLASLTFRNEEQMFRPGPIEKQYLEQILPEKLRLALKYRGARTFISDLEIICRTVLGFKSPSMQRFDGEASPRGLFQENTSEIDPSHQKDELDRTCSWPYSHT
jgi:lipopolysaccharide/colanic/teichoic acid biosynthesis glycosyltransferase